MNISITIDERGSITEQINLSEEEKLAIKKAYRVVSERCRVEHTMQQKENIYWCLLGALRIGGVDGLERYIQEAKINKGTRLISAGYSGWKEDEPEKRTSSP